MIEDMKKQLTQLVEVNNILAQDLEDSRRLIAELCRERDTLHEKMAELEEEIPSQYYAEIESEKVRATEQLRRQLTQEQRKAEELHREYDFALRRTYEERKRADLAEKRLHSLAMKLREVLQERNEFKTQLDEMTSAMDEIRYHLAASIRMPDFAREIETGC